ncbi:hypothetical protein RSOL_417520 [Rhizoctonia solani AG-3 Rhs1AP]|nr:hypothetical protein RSOL_417520 [Rhizoctonia solani AG-3 Rhs1AP]
MHTMVHEQYLTSKHTSPTGLFTPPPSPYTLAGSAPSMSTGAHSQQSNSNGCKMGASTCSHSDKYHQPQNCRCKRSMNIYCSACRTWCYTHGC